MRRLLAILCLVMIVSCEQRNSRTERKSVADLADVGEQVEVGDKNDMSEYPEIVEFPQTHVVKCGSAGERTVVFEAMDDDYELFLVDGLGNKVVSEILESWELIWKQAEPKIDELLSQYNRDITVQEVLASSEESPDVCIMLPYEGVDPAGAKFRFSLSIKAKGAGPYTGYFGVEFLDLVADDVNVVF